MKQWIERFKVYDFFCKNQECQLSYLLHMMLETSNEQSRDLGSSTDDLMKEGLTWMLYKWNVEIDRYPQYLEEIEIQTWVSSFEKIRINREFVIQCSGKTICRAQAVFIVVDLKKKKPIALPSSISSSYPIWNRKNFERVEKIGKGDLFISNVKWNVLRRDIDMNHHVNNIVFVDWLWEALPKEYAAKGQAEKLNIIYLQEVRYPSEVDVCCFYATENSLILEIRSEVVHARAQLQWKNH